MLFLVTVKETVSWIYQVEAADVHLAGSMALKVTQKCEMLERDSHGTKVDVVKQETET